MARLIGGFVKSALVAKVFQIAAREMAKPENQRRAKELFARVAHRRSNR